jgi:MHS family proline/betaine transporter-like MFS transporter
MAAPKSWTEASPLVSAQRSINATSRMALLKKVGPALLGNMIEFYEFGIYALVTEAIHENFFGKDDSYGVWIGFGISFVARPFGGFFFGFLADRISRRFALLVSIAGMIIATGGIGLLPTRSCCGEVWGWFGLILLIAFKVTQGLCVGGELTTVVVFCGEHAGRLHAGFGVALAVFTAGLGTVMSELVVLVIDRFLDDEQMMTWGWRIPFLLVFPWGIAARPKARPPCLPTAPPHLPAWCLGRRSCRPPSRARPEQLGRPWPQPAAACRPQSVRMVPLAVPRV